MSHRTPGRRGSEGAHVMREDKKNFSLDIWNTPEKSYSFTVPIRFETWRYINQQARTPARDPDQMARMLEILSPSKVVETEVDTPDGELEPTIYVRFRYKAQAKQFVSWLGRALNK